MENTTNKGLLHGAAAYFLWGIFPIYWKLLKAAHPLEILCHRILWSLLFVAVILLMLRRREWLTVARQRRTLLLFAGSSLLLAINWLTFIYAVNSGFIVEASLGYFINPLFNVLLGFIFLRERLRPAQTAAVGLAGLGVLWLTMRYGAFPWLAMALAVTFGLYGLLRKIAPLGSLEGLCLETLILAFPALIGIAVLQRSGHALFLHRFSPTLLLFFAGPVTAVPLILFSSSARRISLTALGLLQYIAPTLQFLVGVWIYREPFSLQRFIGFAVIWTALALYMIESYRHARALTLSPAPIE